MKLIFNKQEELEHLVREARIGRELQTLGVTGAIHNTFEYDQKVFNHINRVATCDKERLQYTQVYLNHKNNYRKLYKL